MTERDKHIEMAQRLGLVGMRPHLDGIYIEVLAAFAKIVADDARATHDLPVDYIKASVKRIRDDAKLALSSDDYKEVDLFHMRSVFEHIMIESVNQETDSEKYKLGLALRMLDVIDMAEKARATPALPHILQDIAENSVPLGAEFEAAMMKNLSSMYEYDGKPQALPQGGGEWIEARLPLARDSRGRGSKK